MLMTPRSLPRSAATGRTSVSRAKSTEVYTPYPTPSTSEATTAPVHVCHTASSIVAAEMTRPDQTTKTLRRPVRSDQMPLITTVPSSVTASSAVRISTPVSASPR